MRLPRASIRAAMVAVAAIAVAVAALLVATDTWRRALYTATAGAYLVCAVRGRVRPGPDGAGWAGAALLGGGYFLLAVGPWAADGIKPNPNLLTTPGVEWLVESIYPLDMKRYDGTPLALMLPDYLKTRENSRLVLHIALSWVLALVGAGLGRRFGRDRGRVAGAASSPARSPAARDEGGRHP